MVCPKRVISVLLALCALTALCAVGASAETSVSLSPEFDDSLSSSVVSPVSDSLPTSKSISRSSRSVTIFNHASRAEQFAAFGWSVDPDYFFYEAGSLLCTIRGDNFYKSSDGPCIAVLVSNNTSFSQPYLTTPSTGDSNTNKTYTNFYRNTSSTVSGEHSTITIDSNDYYVSTGLGYTSGYSSTNIPELPYTSQPRSEIVLSTLLRSGFSSLEPSPDPEPDPDAYNPIPDVYTSLTPSLYFTNYKSTGENSFAYLNRSFSEFPSPDYAWTTQFPDVILGAFYNNFSSNLEPLDSIAGQASVVFTDPLGIFTDFSLISSLSSYGVVPFSDVEIWLVNGSEPTLSGFQYFVCPSSWISTKLWRYPISQYSTEYVCNFQINLPEDYTETVGFTPVNFFVRIYRSTAGSSGVGRPYDVWYDVTNFVIGVYDRPSSDPEDIPPVPYNPSFSDPSNPGQEVTNALDEEERRISESYNPDESMDSANSTFDLSALGSAFSRLADGIGYTGSSFSFKFPASGTVPFLNVSLWNETEIPFKEWIDALPVSLLYVVRFLAWLGLGFSFANMIRKLISDLNGGDKD